MKKNYSKPEIMFEDFTVSCAIASCEVTAVQAWDICGYPIASLGGKTVFMSSATGCKYTEVEPYGDGTDGSYQGICYHVPNDHNLFGS